MAAKFTFFLCILAIWAVDSACGASSHNAPTPSTDCSTLVLTMADCLSFLSNGSTIKKPEGTCCSGLKSVLKSDPACLCQAFRSSTQLGVVLNVTKAVTLPAACKVSAPSATNCGLSVTPAAAPAGTVTPTSSPKSTVPAPGASESGAASNEVSPSPAPHPGNSASSLFPISVGSVLVCLSVAIFTGF
ncbi:hypothetical protein L6164_036299 [Bauhinia variegata]|uniref:Uncharacterized protein n=1 Tax=Bauhinia variegata TaxID=167791 RepID=A0ACB9KGL1_BAUVA|nr:hypothetical protein L6164_036299 [Bauhinia variegata]